MLCRVRRGNRRHSTVIVEYGKHVMTRSYMASLIGIALENVLCLLSRIGWHNVDWQKE